MNKKMLCYFMLLAVFDLLGFQGVAAKTATPTNLKNHQSA
jgi:hypothetical protein